MDRYFDRLLVANRGEIARRVIRTARRLGIYTIAVCSEADTDAPFAKEADESHVIGPPPPRESYLDIDRVMSVAKKSGADAVHPGYGFLSESAVFVRAVEEAGIVFVGPSVATMERVSSKIAARALAESVRVPVVPGTSALGSLQQAVEFSRNVGFPVLIKASGGGGGIGMSLVKKESKLEAAFLGAKKKGADFFGDETVFVEKYIENPAHVEVQILGDQHGKVVALGERDCTVQRRHQKILEEAPSPRLSAGVREEMFAAAVRVARASDYVGAGTVEMIVDTDVEGSFYFLEVNARLQVEHPVTEMQTGLDLVELQLLVAAGNRLPEEVFQPVFGGHTIEARLCAEDPDKRFFPSPGTLSEVTFPESMPGVRIDSGVESGSEVSPSYDSLLAKLIVHGASREEAMGRLVEALQQTKLSGITTNLSVFPRIIENEVFRAGRHTTHFLRDDLGLRS